MKNWHAKSYTPGVIPLLQTLNYLYFCLDFFVICWKLTTVDPQERSTWRSGVRSAMHAALSQLPGKGSTDVDDAPAR